MTDQPAWWIAEHRVHLPVGQHDCAFGIGHHDGIRRHLQQRVKLAFCSLCPVALLIRLLPRVREAGDTPEQDSDQRQPHADACRPDLPHDGLESNQDVAPIHAHQHAPPQANKIFCPLGLRIPGHDIDVPAGMLFFNEPGWGRIKQLCRGDPLPLEIDLSLFSQKRIDEHISVMIQKEILDARPRSPLRLQRVHDAREGILQNRQPHLGHHRPDKRAASILEWAHKRHHEDPLVVRCHILDNYALSRPYSQEARFLTQIAALAGPVGRCQDPAFGIGDPRPTIHGIGFQ